MYNSNLSNVLKLLWETNLNYKFIQLHPVCPINGRTMNLQNSEAKFLVECQAVLSQSAAKWSSSEGFQDKSSPGSKVKMMIKSLGWDEVCCVEAPNYCSWTIYSRTHNYIMDVFLTSWSNCCTSKYLSWNGGNIQLNCTPRDEDFEVLSCPTSPFNTVRWSTQLIFQPHFHFQDETFRIS